MSDNAVRREVSTGGHETSWTTDNRPTNPNHGTAGYNETLGVFEIWDALLEEWVSVGGLPSGISTAEIGVLDAVTPGTSAASKALVLGSDGKLENITFTTAWATLGATAGTFTPSKALVPTAAGLIAGIPKVSSGSGAPNSTPTKVGDLYVDTATGRLYVAKAAASSADWIAHSLESEIPA